MVAKSLPKENITTLTPGEFYGDEPLAIFSFFGRWSIVFILCLGLLMRIINKKKNSGLIQEKELIVDIPEYTFDDWKNEYDAFFDDDTIENYLQDIYVLFLKGLAFRGKIYGNTNQRSNVIDNGEVLVLPSTETLQELNQVFDFDKEEQNFLNGLYYSVFSMHGGNTLSKKHKHTLMQELLALVKKRDALPEIA